MSDKYILANHIEKLGHPITEIRQRALFSIVSKIENSIPFDNNLARTKELFNKLFHWFLFEPCSHENIVFSLLRRLIESDTGQIVIKHYGTQFILSELNKIEGCIDPQYYNYVEQIRDMLKTRNEVIIPPLTSEVPLSYRSNASYNYSPYVGSTASVIEGYIHKECSQDQRDGKVDQASNHNDNLINGESTYRVEDFCFTECLPNYTMKFQPLIESDKHVLESIENSLRHPQSSTIIHSCEFFTNVLLHDFPAEIFLQRPGIIYKLQSILATNCSSKIIHAVLDCLYFFTKCLEVRINHSNDPAMLNSKLDCLLKPSESSPTHSENPEIFEKEDTMQNLINNQLPVPNYCTSVLITVLKIMCLKEQSTENYITLNKVGYYLSLRLLSELHKALHLSMNKQIYVVPQTPRTSEVSKLFNEVLLEYGDTLEYFRVESSICEKDLHLRVIYLHILHNITDLLETFVPIEISKAVLPRNLKNTLATSLVDLSLNRLYPKTHDILLKYVESFSYNDEDLHKYKLVKQICSGMAETMKLLKNHKSLKFMECLQLMKTALPSLTFHMNLELVVVFINLCSEHLINYFEDSTAMQTIEEIMLILLSHHSISVREQVYKICQKKVIDYISPKSERIRSSIVGSEILFILSSKVLNEIAFFGFTTDNTTIQNCSEDILIYIMKCKELVSENIWNKVVQCLIECLPIICCHLDKNSSLGRCIINFADPDTANCYHIPSIVIVKCNTQFLFSKDAYLREEAFSRLCWFMANQENARDLLPRFNTLYDKSLANVFKLSVISDVNKHRRTEHFYQASSLQQVLEVLKSKNVEPVIRRSALNQVSVMIEDCLLHQIFFDSSGVDIVLNIMKTSLMEKDYDDYPDSIIPIASILKNICFYNSTVRDKLSRNIDIFYYILRGLFLFFTEERMRQDAASLLFLLIFKDFLKGSPSKSDFSVPELIAKKLNVPFDCITSLKSSEHTTHDLKESSILDKWCLSALQIQWNADIFGGFDKLMKWKNIDYESKGLKIEEILKMDDYSLRLIQASSIPYCIAKNLNSIQNGTNHNIVMDAIDNLKLYICLYRISEKNFKENTLLSQPWEQSLCRFLRTLPSSSDDASLLNKVITILCAIVPLYKNSDNCWIMSMLKDSRQVILDLLCEDNKNDRLILQLLNLITICVVQEQRYLDCYCHSKIIKNKTQSWEHVITTIIENLRSNTQHVYKLAYMDALLCCLVHLTATLGWSNSISGSKPKEMLVRHISELSEMVDTFHYGKGASASLSVMGLSITRNVVLILNHLSAELLFCKVKNWEIYYMDDNLMLKKSLALWTSRDVILRAAALQLFNGFLKSPRAMPEIVHQAKTNNSNLWAIVMTILIDHCEACIVRENAAQILANLTCQDNVIDITHLLDENDFYNHFEHMLNVLFTLKCSNNENDQFPTNYFKDSGSKSSSVETNISITTPGLIKSTLIFLYNVVNLTPDVAISKLNERGLVKMIFRILCIPSVSIDDTKELALYCDILNMNAYVCMLLKKLSGVNSLCTGTILHTEDCLNVLFSLLNNKIYYIHLPELLYLRNKLWSEIFNLLSNIIEFIDNCGEKSNILLHEINEIFLHTVINVGPEIFFDALVECLCSIGSKDLQNAALQFLICLMKLEINRIFNIETDKGNTTGDTFQIILDNTRISTNLGIDADKNNIENIDPIKLSRSNKKSPNDSNNSYEINILDEIYFNKIITGKTKDFVNDDELNFAEDNSGIIVSRQICKILLLLYDTCDVQMPRDNIYVKKKPLIISGLSGLLCISKEAKEFALNCNLLTVIIKQLRECHIRLSLESVDCLRRVQDKKRVHPILFEINSLIGLLTNFISDSENVKNSAADLNLADIVHKLWIWFLVQSSYIVDVLKLLSVFTTNCTRACQTIPLTSSVAGSGPRKVPSNISLLHALISLVHREMQQMSKIRCLNCLKLSLNILQNCCDLLECRIWLSKSNLFDSISRIHPVLTKRQKPWDDVEMLWLKFLEIYTNYPEGQTVAAKHNEVFEFLLSSSSGPRILNREISMKVLRNITFYQPNKSKLLSSSEFLGILKTKLQNGTYEEKKMTIIIVWSLSANYQKAKLIFKSMQLDIAIENILRQYHLMKEGHGKVTPGDVEDIQYVLDILRQNDKIR